jgi:hypothetical protein
MVCVRKLMVLLVQHRTPAGAAAVGPVAVGVPAAAVGPVAVDGPVAVCQAAACPVVGRAGHGWPRRCERQYAPKGRLSYLWL